MEQEILDKYILAGRIAGQAREYGKGLVKKDVLLLDVAEKIEARIRELGGEPAFPVNISLDSCAAHDTPETNDERVFSTEVVKLDCGVHVDGCVGGDTAVTIDLSGEHTDLVKASREALNAAVKKVQIGVELGELGKVIEEVITSYGFQPIRNLSGHGLGYETVHQAPTIPNYGNGDSKVLEDGMLIAIEPFATTGIGLIENKGIAQIHGLVGRKPTRNMITRKILKEIARFRGLPFATRWLDFPMLKINFAYKDLNNLGILHSYPPLVEKEKGIVSQAEHAIYVTDKPIVLTKKID